jgi:hypothetical protein
VTSTGHIPLVVDEEIPFPLNTCKSLEKKNKVMGTTESETINYCAAENQQ